MIPSLYPGNLIRKKEERNQMELECHLALQRWDDAVVLLTQMLRQTPDHWTHIDVYISCQIQRYKKSVRDVREGHAVEGGEGCEGCEGGEGGRGKGVEVWEGKGEKEEEVEEEGGRRKEGGSEGEQGVREEGDRGYEMNQLNTVEGGTERCIPRLV